MITRMVLDYSLLHLFPPPAVQATGLPLACRCSRPTVRGLGSFCWFQQQHYAQSQRGHEVGGEGEGEHRD